MQTYERSVRIRAPLDAVWEFHSTVDGLEALTPGWMHLTVEEVYGPDGTSDPEILETGSTLSLSVQPFGVGPRQSFVSEISARERADETASFTDVMHDGPFRSWEHSHRFVADGDETLLTDHIEYRLPLGGVGEAVAPVAVVGFEPMFRYRHRRTKALLES